MLQIQDGKQYSARVLAVAVHRGVLVLVHHHHRSVMMEHPQPHQQLFAAIIAPHHYPHQMKALLWITMTICQENVG